MAFKPPKAGGVGGIQGHTLQINVVGCRNLTDKEWFSRQDPYVIIEYANTKFRTRTDTDGGKNPTFNEKFTVPLIEGLRELNVQVWNSNTVSTDDYIGVAKVLLERVLTSGYDDSSWLLKSKHGKTSGEVNLILHYANTKSQKEEKFAGTGYGSGYQPAPSGYPPAGYGAPPAGYGAPPPSGYPPAHVPSGPHAGYPGGHPPAHAQSFQGAPSGFPPAGGYPAPPSAYPPVASGYPPAASASGHYPAPSGYPPASGYPPSGYPQGPAPAPYPAPYPAPAPGHAPAGYPAAPHGYGGAYPGHKAGKVHVGSSGHYKHGKHGKHGKHKKSKGYKFFGKKFKGWKGKK